MKLIAWIKNKIGSTFCSSNGIVYCKAKKGFVGGRCQVIERVGMMLRVVLESDTNVTRLIDEFDCVDPKIFWNELDKRIAESGSIITWEDGQLFRG